MLIFFRIRNLEQTFDFITTRFTSRAIIHNSTTNIYTIHLHSRHRNFYLIVIYHIELFVYFTKSKFNAEKLAP